MGYPSEIKAAIRQIAKNVVTVSCPFAIKDRLDIGGRMSLINFAGNVVVFSPIPHGEYVQQALDLLVAESGAPAQITHVFIVNFQHNLAAKSYKKAYPDVKIIAGYNVDLGPDCPIDYVLGKDQGNRVLSGADLESELGLVAPWKDQLDVVFLRYHKNKDVVLFHKEYKILFEGDVIMNIGAKDEHGAVEQYSPATGFPEKHYPFTGWSYLLRFCHPDGFMGRWISSRVNLIKNPKAVEGLKVVEGLDFEVIVPCHGNVISSGAKQTFRELFKDVLA